MQAEPHEIRGHHVLVAMLLFFGTIVAMNGYFIYKATTTFTGQDVPKSYVQGLKYNEVLAAREEMRALGWRARLGSDRLGERLAVTAELTDAAGAPLDGLTLTGTLRRPTQAALDRPLVFVPAAEGRYTAALTDVAPGAWVIIVEAPLPDGRVFTAERRVTIER